MFDAEVSQISPTGLRYTTKAGGSPYQAVGGSGHTMSCIKCGHHRLRSNGIFRRYPTALMFFCFDCKPRPREA
jgi:hypothetical protein